MWNGLRRRKGQEGFTTLTYRGIPIIQRDYIPRGKVIVVKDVAKTDLFKILDINTYLDDKPRKEVSMNIHDWSVRLTKKEGLKKSINVAQVKELLRLILIDLAHMKPQVRESIIARYKNK